jgi:phosphoglycolate phosphatase
MLMIAMRETGAAPRDTVMIGDTSYDMEMARAAGVAAIGVNWGYHAPELLYASGAHHVVETFDSLRHLLAGSPVTKDFAAI